MSTPRTKPAYRPKIEALFRAWIEWDIDDTEKGDKNAHDVTVAIRELKHPKSVYWTNSAATCWTAQIVITGPRRASVEKFANKVLRLLARYKKMTIHAGVH